MNCIDRPTVLMSNSLELLLTRLKAALGSHLHDPLYRHLILVSDNHVMRALEVDLARANDVVLGVDIKSIEEFIRDKKTSYQEIHLYAVSALIRDVNDLLFSLCQSTKVIYYVLSPCMHFWSDICSDFEAKKLTRKLHKKQADAIQEYLYDRSKLLANNVTPSRELVRYFEEKLEDFEEQYAVKEWVVQDASYGEFVRHDVVSEIIPTKPTLFDLLQTDLLLMGVSPKDPIPLENDTTIQVHKAPTAQREVEILYLYIQEAMKLTSGRIVVLAPDIEVYRPYIQSLFTHSSEIIGVREHEILPSLLQILESKSLQPKKLYELFQNYSFSAKRGLEADDLSLLAAALEHFDSLRDEAILSWITSLDAPLAFTSTDAEAIGKCLYTISNLQSDINKLQAKKKRVSSEWQALFIAILNAYFEPTVMREEYFAIKSALIKACQDKSSIEEIELEEALNIFKARVKEEEEKRSSLTQARILFATLGTVRTLPRDVVCFLGMTEGCKGSIALDFVHATQSVQDRHLVIEAILATKSMLYISHKSYAFKERCHLAPTGIVLDLLQTLDRMCTLNGKKPSELIIKTHSLESSTDELQENRPPSSPRSFFEATLTHPEILSLDELRRVAKYPLRAYMQHGLNLYINEYKPKVRSSEFEALTPMNTGMLRKTAFMLKEDVRKERASHEFRLLPEPLMRATSALLEEEVAELTHNALTLGFQPDSPLQVELSLSCKAPVEYAPGCWKVPAIAITVEERELFLVGTIRNLYNQGIAVFDKKSSDARYTVWPELLVLHVLEDKLPVTPQILYLKDKNSERFSFTDPEALLQEYVAYVLKARKVPLCLYPDWISALIEHEVPPEKLFQKNNYKIRDPYLDLYLSGLSPNDLENSWRLSRTTAKTLFAF